VEDASKESYRVMHFINATRFDEREIIDTNYTPLDILFKIRNLVFLY